MATHGEGKEVLQTYLRTVERQMLQVVWRDTDSRTLKKEEMQHEKHRGNGLQSEVELGRPYDKNGLAQMSTSRISVGHKN
jgi:hypothetical protein